VVDECAQALVLRDYQWVVTAGQFLKVSELETEIIVRTLHDAAFGSTASISPHTVHL
jgi:hypothetical protein